MKSRINNLNDALALKISGMTGNMWFFWIALFFVLLVRGTNPPNMHDLLLNVENDLQLLLLAVAAVVNGKQLANQQKQMDSQQKMIENQLEILRLIKTEEDEIKEELSGRNTAEQDGM